MYAHVIETNQKYIISENRFKDIYIMIMEIPLCV